MSYTQPYQQGLPPLTIHIVEEETLNSPLQKLKATTPKVEAQAAPLITKAASSPSELSTKIQTNLGTLLAAEQEKNQVLTTRNAALADESAALLEKNEELVAQNEELMGLNESLLRQNADLGAANDDLNQAYFQSRQEISALRAQLAQQQQHPLQNGVDKTAHVAELSQHLTALTEQNKRLQQALQDKDAQLGKLKGVLAQNTRELNGVGTVLAKNAAEIDALQKALSAKDEEIAALKAALSANTVSVTRLSPRPHNNRTARPLLQQEQPQIRTVYLQPVVPQQHFATRGRGAPFPPHR